MRAFWEWVISILDNVKSLLKGTSHPSTAHKQPSHEFTKGRVAVHKACPKPAATVLSTTPAERYHVSKERTKQVYDKKISYFIPATLTKMKTMGGVGTAAKQISNEKDFDPGLHKIGVVVAANHGLPLGGLAESDKLKKTITTDALKLSTQEETLMANCIMTACGNDFNKQNEWAQKNVIKKWGLTQPVYKSTDTNTLQGIDYTKSTSSDDYGDAWIVKNAKVSAVDYRRALQPNPVTVDLIFSAGPNANAEAGSAEGSMKRTLNQRAINDYSYFRECIKFSLRGVLDGAANAGDTHVFLARTSGGVYAGDYKDRIIRDFERIVNEVLDECVDSLNVRQRRHYFVKVIISDI